MFEVVGPGKGLLWRLHVCYGRCRMAILYPKFVQSQTGDGVGVVVRDLDFLAGGQMMACAFHFFL